MRPWVFSALLILGLIWNSLPAQAGEWIRQRSIRVSYPNFGTFERTETYREFEPLLHQPRSSTRVTEEWGFDPNWASVRMFPVDQRPVKVFIATEGPGYRPHLYDMTLRAMAQWEESLAGRLRYEFVDSPDEAQITVSWVSHFDEADMAGNTSYTVGHAAIDIKTVGLPDNIIEGNILHEFGHALGLGEHSGHNHDVMVACRQWHSVAEYRTYQPKLSNRDVKAIRHLYSAAWVPGEDIYQNLSRRERETASRDLDPPPLMQLAEQTRPANPRSEQANTDPLNPVNWKWESTSPF